MAKENYQEQQVTLSLIQKKLIDQGWLKTVKDRWGFSCRFALFLKLVLFVWFFQQAVTTAYGLGEQVDSAQEVVFFNRIPRDFYLGATTLPSPLHLAAGLNDYRPIHAIREP